MFSLGVFMSALSTLQIILHPHRNCANPRLVAVGCLIYSPMFLFAFPDIGFDTDLSRWMRHYCCDNIYLVLMCRCVALYGTQKTSVFLCFFTCFRCNCVSDGATSCDRCDYTPRQSWKTRPPRKRKSIHNSTRRPLKAQIHADSP